MYGLTNILHLFEVVIVRPKVWEILAALVEAGRDVIGIAANQRRNGLALSLHASELQLPFRL